MFGGYQFRGVNEGEELGVQRDGVCFPNLGGLICRRSGLGLGPRSIVARFGVLQYQLAA